MFDLGIVNGSVFINGTFRKTNIYIHKDKIAAISDDVLGVKETYDALNRLVIPGIIDPHVHFSLGGKVTSVDDFYQGSVCAAYGGITTFIDFLDPIERGEEIQSALEKRRKLAETAIVNYGFHLTVKNPVNIREIVNKMGLYHLKSVKLFTTYSDSGRRTYDKEIKELLAYSSIKDFIVMAHIEKDDLIVLNDTFTVSDLGQSRPSEAETEEALHIAEMAKSTKGKCYMVHLSSGKTLQRLLKEYKGLINTSFFIESCPHYFTLTADKLDEDRGYLYTMAPPLRSEAEMNRLNALSEYVYSIGTDHCSYTSKQKDHPLLKDVPMGIGGIEHSFDIMYHLMGEKCIEKMTLHPALAFGLYPQKGHIRVGADADLMIYDASRQSVIEKGHSNSDYTVFEGMLVSGKVESTLVNGKFVMFKGTLIGGRGNYVYK